MPGPWPARRSSDSAGLMRLRRLHGDPRKRGTPPKPVTAMTLDESDEVIDVNLKGIFLTNRAVLPTMIEQRGDHHQRFVNVSVSRAGRDDGAAVLPSLESMGSPNRSPTKFEATESRSWQSCRTRSTRRCGSRTDPVPPPGNALPPDHVADLIVFLLTQPRDTVLLDPVIVPLGAQAQTSQSDGRGGGTNRLPAKILIELERPVPQPCDSSPPILC